MMIATFVMIDIVNVKFNFIIKKKKFIINI